ncbi:MAG: hypothetical protein QNJ98_05040 [Planctomycetota bacterium]|nr:hypothetical protein [Planctomycetota bacterium]
MPRAALAFLLLFCFALPALADDETPPSAPAEDAPEEEALDVVTLEGGNQVEGKIESETEDKITVRIRSEGGGASRVTLPRSRVRKIEYGASNPRGSGMRVEGVGPTPVREDWFLLQTEGRTVGIRHLAMWGSGDANESGWRIEETLEYFMQNPYVPAVMIRRVEETDLRFVLRRTLFREEGREAIAEGGPEAYLRTMTGRVEDGLWKGRMADGRTHKTNEVLLPSETRGPLGHREFILRRKREIGLDEVLVFDGKSGELVATRTGFVGLQQRPRTQPGMPAAPPRDELHWEARGTRHISWYGQGTKVVQETVAEGVVAIPVSKAAATAAQENATRRAKDPQEKRIKLPEGGISFELPDPSWVWQPQTATPSHTSWRKLGRLEAPIHTADVRIELHPEEALNTPGLETAAAWLKERLSSVCKDLRLAQKPQALSGVKGAWRVGYTGTLKGESIYTLAVVVDRGERRTLVLVACPKASWEQARPALERFIASVNLL